MFLFSARSPYNQRLVHLGQEARTQFSSSPLDLPGVRRFVLVEKVLTVSQIPHDLLFIARSILGGWLFQRLRLVVLSS